MELDTGSAVSIILFDLYQQRFNRLSLHKTGLSLKTYTGENIVPVGILKVLVDYQTQIKLLGLEWSEWAPPIVSVPKIRQTFWWLQGHSKSRTTSRAVPSSSHWRHLSKPCWWAKILKDWPPLSIPLIRDGRKFKEISHYQHPYGTVSVQPTSVWRHLCICYLAAHHWSIFWRNVWNKLYPQWYGHHWKERWRASCQPWRSFTSLSGSWVKSKQDKVWDFRKKITFCRNDIDSHGLHKSPEKVEVVLKAPRPYNEAEVRSFLVVVNHYYRFLPNLSTEVYPFEPVVREQLSIEMDRTMQISILQRERNDAVLSQVMNDETERPIAITSMTLAKTVQG